MPNTSNIAMLSHKKKRTLFKINLNCKRSFKPKTDHNKKKSVYHGHIVLSDYPWKKATKDTKNQK